MKKCFLFIAAVVLLSSCGSGYSPLFYVRNHENTAVNVQYKYAPPQEERAMDYPPQAELPLSKRLVQNDDLTSLWTAPRAHFKENAATTKIDALEYQVTIPAKSTLFILPVYKYQSATLDYLVINQTDTLRFLPEEPYLEAEELREKGLFSFESQLLGESFYMLDVKLPAIKSALQKK